MNNNSFFSFLINFELIDFFPRFIFGKSRKSSNMLQATQPSRDPEDGNSSRHGDDSFLEDNTGQIKIIHKDQVIFIHSKTIC